MPNEPTDHEPNRARRNFPDIPFVCDDVLATEGACLQACLEAAGEYEGGAAAPHFDLVFIDINGNRMLQHVLKCVKVIRAVLVDPPPRLIVVKSSEMAAAVAQGDEDPDGDDDGTTAGGY